MKQAWSRLFGPRPGLFGRPMLRFSLWLHMGLVLATHYVPLLILLIYSFNASQLALTWGGFSLVWYEKALSKPEVGRAIANSLAIAISTGLVAAVLGTSLALAIERGSERIKRSGRLLALLPIFVPELIMGVGLLIFMTRVLQPWLQPLGWGLDSFMTVVLGHVTFAVSYVMVTVRARLQHYDRQTELAAMDLGARPWPLLWYIILPQLTPAIFAGALMAISLSLDDFYISYFLTVGGSGFKTVPLYIWNLQGRTALTPEINVISTLMLTASMSCMVIAYLIRPPSRGRSH
ncbi:MAG: ABC transporter permease [Oligoflexus sp.]|jgi:ABC-type spermidine/putrescine transport system permease subunit II